MKLSTWLVKCTVGVIMSQLVNYAVVGEEHWTFTCINQGKIDNNFDYECLLSSSACIVDSNHLAFGWVDVIVNLNFRQCSLFKLFNCKGSITYIIKILKYPGFSNEGLSPTNYRLELPTCTILK